MPVSEDARMDGERFFSLRNGPLPEKKAKKILPTFFITVMRSF
jgi:hypothetical protein